MPITKETLKGYILEEVLAYFIRRTGYKLLVHPDQDPIELIKLRNSLWVKGRGGIHQVDVLGQLEWIPAFTFPLRLFIEAKFRKGKMGIDVVRNAIGTILDINQNNPPTPNQTTISQKYHYAYALFSTSGFSEMAMRMALAHQISLIDLSGNEFNNLRNVIDRVANTIVSHRDVPNEGDEEEGTEDFDENNILSRGKLVLGVRHIIRESLGTLPPIDIPEEDRPRIMPWIREALEPIITVSNQYDELFVAMANGPYMLLLKADNPTSFRDYAIEHPRHKVTIKWSPQIDNGKTWIVKPTENLADGRSAYSLSFKLPEIISRWIFEASEDARKRALKVKEDVFSSITIYRHEEDQDYLIRLDFDSESIQISNESVNIG